MQMKIRFSHIPLATTLAVVFASLGCQSAKKPVAPLLPPAAPAPVQAQSTPSSHPTAPHPAASHPTIEAQKPAPAPVHATEDKPDPVQDLITKAEAEYKAGLDLSLAGQTEQAKGHFDRAFSLLLGSPAGMRSDPRYQKEFDRITEGVSTLEAASQPPPDSAAEKPEEQKSEPAPIDEANEVTNYPVDPNLKAKAAAEIKATHSDLPLMMTDPTGFPDGAGLGPFGPSDLGHQRNHLSKLLVIILRTQSDAAGPCNAIIETSRQPDTRHRLATISGDNFNLREEDIFDGLSAFALLAIPEEAPMEPNMQRCVELTD